MASPAVIGEKPLVAIDMSASNEKVGSDDDTQSSTAGLNGVEKEIIERQTSAPNEKVGYFSLFRYADKKDIAIMLVATFASIVAGSCLPLMTLVYGNFAGSFTSFSVDSSAKQAFQNQTNTMTLYFVYLGIASFVSVYVGMIGMYLETITCVHRAEISKAFRTLARELPKGFGNSTCAPFSVKTLPSSISWALARSLPASVLVRSNNPYQYYRSIMR